MILYTVDQILFLLGVPLYLVVLGEFLAKDMKSSLSFLYWGSQRPALGSVTHRTHRAQHVVILIAKIYCIERTQIKISKVKTVSSFQESFPNGAT